MILPSLPEVTQNRLGPRLRLEFAKTGARLEQTGHLGYACIIIAANKNLPRPEERLSLVI